MTRKNQYAAGAAFERAVRKRLEDEGYLVLRSAGSKSQIDLVAWMPGPEGHTLFIQCSIAERPKSRAERLALIDLAADHRARPVMWTKRDGPEFLDGVAA